MSSTRKGTLLPGREYRELGLDIVISAGKPADVLLAELQQRNMAMVPEERLIMYMLSLENLADRCAIAGRAGLQLAVIKVAVSIAIALYKKTGEPDSKTKSEEVEETEEVQELPDDPEALRALVKQGRKKQ